MNKNYPFSELKQRLDSAAKILIVLPQRPLFDQVAAALALSLALEETGKNAPVICSSPMTVEFNRLVGVNKISDKIRGTDLIISLNYPSDQIEKVSYNDDNNRPNVVIQPKAGAQPLNESLAVFSYAGSGADLIISVGLKDPGRLNLSGLDLAGSYLVNLDTDPNNTQFGQLNLVDFESACLSEVALGAILGLGLPLSVDASQNLLSGMWQQTRGLTSSFTGADTYEAMAICLRNGAQKPSVEPRPAPVSVPTPTPVRSMDEKKAPEVKEQKGAPKPPADWFEPKIFKGNTFP